MSSYGDLAQRKVTGESIEKIANPQAFTEE
jgi:hypothetical protein